jgi:hypothetical protein
MRKASQELIDFLERRNPGWQVRLEVRRAGKFKVTALTDAGSICCNAAMTTSDNQRHFFNVERKLRTKHKGYYDGQ